MRNTLTAFAIFTSAAVVAVPAVAQAPVADAAVQGQAQFIDKLSNEAFGVLRDRSMSKAAARAKFRGMLRENVALAEIGNRLIRRQRASITPAQFAAYQAALPEFVLNAYADRLYDFVDADLKVVRTLPRNAAVTDVYSRVTRPSGRPLDTIWQVRTMAPGKFMISNLTVEGINLSLTQEADFSAYIQKNGFDKLVEFMKSSNAKAPV